MNENLEAEKLIDRVGLADLFKSHQKQLAYESSRLHQAIINAYALLGRDRRGLERSWVSLNKVLFELLTGLQRKLLLAEKPEELQDAISQSADAIISLCLFVSGHDSAAITPNGAGVNLKISDGELLARFEQADGRSLQDILNDLEGKK